MKKAVLGLGSNLGRRSLYFNQFLQQLRYIPGINLKNTSYLYSSLPALFDAQPDFVNAAIEIETSLEPKELIQKLQPFQQNKCQAERYGPRELDIDILLYEGERISTDFLTIPHQRLRERQFVLKPLIDLGYKDSVPFDDDIRNIQDYSLDIEEESCTQAIEMIGKEENILFKNISKNPLLMGILNLTPDSFSDGGKYYDEGGSPSLQIINAAIDSMMSKGCDIIDIGGESTRPGAKPVAERDEWDRIVGTLKALSSRKNVCFSVDTLKTPITNFSINEGVHMINYVAGESASNEVFELVAKNYKSLCIMHNKGDSQTMDKLSAEYSSKGCSSHVLNWLEKMVNSLVQDFYIPKWNIWIDPGLGFAKNEDQNWEIMNDLFQFVEVHNQVLLGASRKRFIRSILPNDVDLGTSYSTLLGARSGVKMFRVHDIGLNKNSLDFWCRLEKSRSL